jgi:hypothetical protein
VVPFFIEGTVAGSAAAYVAGQQDGVRDPAVERERLCRRHKRLLVQINGQQVDQALVEVTLLATRFVGSRAVWETGSLRQVFVSRAQPVNIGLSSIIGMVQPVGPADPFGASVAIVPNGRKVSVPIAPGSFEPVSIGQIVSLQPGIAYPVGEDRPAILALDGEREITLNTDDEVTVTLDLDGPWIVDVERTLQSAVANGAFIV